MIILDTNVLSEPFRQQPNPAVIEWLDRQNALTLYLSTVSLAEVLTGVATMPEGKRKQALLTGVPDLIRQLFNDRVLSFDEMAAREFAQIQAEVRKVGKHIAMADGQIAAIARSHGFMVATRDVSPFKAAGIQVINPWEQVPFL